MKEAKITDPVKARAAVAFLISEGWGIDLHHLNKTLPGGLKDEDWIGIANGCLDYCVNEMAKEKVVPIARFTRH